MMCFDSLLYWVYIAVLRAHGSIVCMLLYCVFIDVLCLLCMYWVYYVSTVYSMYLLFVLLSLLDAGL